MASALITAGAKRAAVGAWRCTSRYGNLTIRRFAQSLPYLHDLMENLCPNARQPLKEGVTRPFTILVEGNIGSGKTTFLEQFAHMQNATILPEPVDRWCKVGGRHNLLTLMYEQPKKYALAMQTYVQLTMLQNHRQTVSTQFKLMERSLYSARYCFVENLFRSGLMSEIETIILDEWFHHLIKVDADACKVDMIVYLRTDPEVALRRVQLRNRDGEHAVSLELLRALHDLHDQWFLQEGGFPLPCERVVCVNANDSPELVREEFHKKVSLFGVDAKSQRVEH